MSSKASTLSHTYFPTAIAEVTINDIVAGEAGINALVAQAYRVPVVLVTGDATTAMEIEPFCPGVHQAIVKESVTRFSANSMHPEKARELIGEQAFLATKSIATAKQVAIALPATLKIQFRTSDYADLASRVNGVVRTGDLSAEIIESNPLELYRTFITVVLLCRGLTE
jgi:D-amino peptidase